MSIHPHTLIKKSQFHKSFLPFTFITLSAVQVELQQWIVFMLGPGIGNIAWNVLFISQPKAICWSKWTWKCCVPHSPLAGCGIIFTCVSLCTQEAACAFVFGLDQYISFLILPLNEKWMAVSFAIRCEYQRGKQDIYKENIRVKTYSAGRGICFWVKRRVTSSHALTEALINQD